MLEMVWAAARFLFWRILDTTFSKKKKLMKQQN